MRMTTTWKYVRPNDLFKVRLTAQLSPFQLKVLTQLYQPLIGAEALSLYMTFLTDAELDRHYSSVKKHQWLINASGLSLDRIYTARLRLEGIGLLRTYRLKKEQSVLYKYELWPPISVERFFTDDLLSLWLYNQVGPTQYKQLRAHFSQVVEDLSDVGGYEEVTTPFHHVFTSLHPSELSLRQGSPIQQDMQETAEAYPLSPQGEQERAPSFDSYQLDLNLIKSLMMKGLELDAIFTEQNVGVIKKLAFLYQLDEFRLAQLIQDSLTLDNRLDMAELKEQAKWYYHRQHGQPPQLRPLPSFQESEEESRSHVKAQKEEEATQETSPPSEVNLQEEQHLHMLESISPIQLLKAYQGGGKVAEADLRLVEELIFEYQLAPNVVNVLIEYILLTNQLRFPRSLVTKVAAHWKRLGISSARQALDLAKKEHQQYKKWQEKRQQETKTDAKRLSPAEAVRHRPQPVQSGQHRDVVPSWVLDQESKQRSAPISMDHREVKKEPDESLLDEAEKRERIKSLLKALGEWEE